MKRFLPLFLCLLVSIFTVARATKPAHIFPEMKSPLEQPTGQQPGPDALIKVQNTGEEVTSDDDESVEGASTDDESTNDDNGDEPTGDEDTGDDNQGNDDDGADADGDDGGE